MPESVLSVRSVTHTFGGLAALQDVSLEVQPGEIHGIIGPNGSGKTTLFDVITGVYQPREGSVVFKGQDVTHWAPHRRTKAGMRRTFQTVGLAPGLTARENVLATVEALEPFRISYPRRSRSAARRRQADELLEFFGMSEFADHAVTEMPLGTTKRLELAKVFSGEPQLVLLDEPFAGLSTYEATDRVRLLRLRCQALGAALVIVEHDVVLLLASCDQLSVLDYGNVIAHGSPNDVISQPNVREAYLGDLIEEVGTT
jgi:ABC-type branched-subunit amino acid transport system ATPase component